MTKRTLPAGWLKRLALRNFLVALALALPAFTAAAQDPKIDSTTVVAPRDHAAVEREIGSFVNAIAVKPGDQSLARWQSQIPFCPLVAGLPNKDGEYILSRVSKIAAAAGAPLAPEHCKGNFFIVVTSDPEAMIKAWSKRDVRMFGDEADQGGTKIREFSASRPIRVWYNAQYYELDGTPLGNTEGRVDQSARATRLEVNSYRVLSSVVAIIDTRRMKGVSFGQVAAYVAMIGLAQIRPEANVAEAPSILNLFADTGKAPPSLTAWDESFLKAVYGTRITDRQQLAEVKAAMVRDVAP
ncbi:MAG TPA: hypothetical protein VHW95_17000 [Steroidobacteraceae bacterium]|jgi:hypothetical protein|nr:hypothetical protein [Steroidobacteraceae bacterium]